jgi:hypothetical protein
VKLVIREKAVVSASIQQNEGSYNRQRGRGEGDLLSIDFTAKRRRFGMNRGFDSPILPALRRYN